MIRPSSALRTTWTYYVLYDRAFIRGVEDAEQREPLKDITGCDI